MFDRSWRNPAAVAATSLALCCTHNLTGQAGTQGTIAVTVTDASNAGISGASLELTAVSTNTVRTSKTEGKGTFNFVGLPIGTYRLAVSQPGFATTQLASIVVQASQTTPVTVLLKVGDTNETVNVAAVAAPLLDSTSNSLGSVIDLKAIENLPLVGRDLTALARLTPGYAGTTGVGLWNGQPLVNQGVNIDGVVGAPSRAKYVGNASASASPRIENIAEMAVQTDQIDLDQGFGRSSMQISYVTRAGSNQFHGRLYVDSRNSGLNANSYSNKARLVPIRRPKLIYNDFGASLGGPILRDKLFFFGSFSTRRVPGGVNLSNSYLTSAAQAGNLTYTGTDGVNRTVNVLTLAGAAGQTSTVNPVVASQLALINKSLSSGSTATTTDPNIGTIGWTSPAPDIYYWPTGRLDWTATQKLHLYLSGNVSKRSTTNASQPPFPGSDFANQRANNEFLSFTAGFGADYQINSRVVNQFKAGYLYTSNKYSTGGQPVTTGTIFSFWPLAASGQGLPLPVSNFYPVLNVADSVSWQKGSHSIKFGGMWVREQDHYWNPPAGFPNINLGLVQGDPAIGAFTGGSKGTMTNAPSSKVAEAQNLYAILAGRISNVNGSFAYSRQSNGYPQQVGAYNLNELQAQWGLFAQDSWRVSQTVTLNYGLRWDFIGANHDLSGVYHSITEANLYGPSTRLFTPGALNTSANPTVDTIPESYSAWNVTPQPQIGFAWNPTGDTMLGKLLGSHDTVVRGGYSLKRFTMPQQYYWNNSSSYGSFFYQAFGLSANNTGQAGSFKPGSLALGQALPAFSLNPTAYQQSYTQASLSMLANSPIYGWTAMDKTIKQPYTQSWNLGVERKFGRRALEVRYVGNRTLRQWVPLDTNEVNIFENGFLQQFKNAQANLAASGGNTFKGALPTPIFDAAFADEATGQYGNKDDYDNGQFTNAIQNGQAGAVAQALAGTGGTTNYICNLIGGSFAPCVNNAGFTGRGAGYPINFFQANPYAAGTNTSLMKAVGFSNYNSMQVDFRQQEWKGWVFDANYTWGKTLGMASTQDYTGYTDKLLTLRNTGLGYSVQPFDVRHTLHLTSTYDLPFGKGRAFLSSNSLLSSLVGNWTVGTVTTLMSGAPFRLYGGNSTYNDYADGGVTLTGVTPKQLQQSIQVRRVPGTPYATLLDPKYLAAKDGTGGPNSQYIQPNVTPGSLGQVVYLYGPKGFYQDLSASKSFPIHDTIQVRLQGEFLNAWNHPVFGSVPTSVNYQSADSNVQDSGFGTGYVTNSPRVIELRANIEF